MGGFDGVTVRQEVGHQVATQQSGDFASHPVVIDGHLGVAVKVVVARTAIDVRVHATRVLIVVGAVSVL